ncbi:hypothetical protein [Cryobacterium zhongshanensis]|uniref:Uncharacterized protein n=1 Tax=Cryobacterium zhongshanensis TaxID=2928153 RepID=A0AA41UGZ5_9MICO|nr:hypothetical protein [Cryobacterium zhongshanensis]MCI4659737.1 hypothetical protein [Cryobacterium zhongshanensis]
MARISADENSERKRISIPKADDSVLAWWDVQKDSGLSVRLLIRNEIERNGYTDAAYRPVAQLPRRGRPPGIGVDELDELGGEDARQGRVFTLDDARPDAPAILDPLQAVAHEPAPVAPPVAVTAPAPVQAPVRAVAAPAAPAPVPQLVAAGGNSFIDDLMNG